MAMERKIRITAGKVQAEAVLGPIPWVHLASSGAIILRPDLHFSAVRPGEMLYGLVAGIPQILQFVVHASAPGASIELQSAFAWGRDSVLPRPTYPA